MSQLPIQQLAVSDQESPFFPWASEIRAMPRAPVLGWRSLSIAGKERPSSVADLPFRAYTTSGRAALLAALHQLDLPPKVGVLVPTYHCPTMVAPILQCGLVPLYFPISCEGLPLVEAISESTARQARVMFVAHYFGLPKSLRSVQEWCHARNIVLVEDCAHSYFGVAGDRAVGQWGDFATASLSKFFPVAEAGLLASARRPLKPLELRPSGWRAQVKGALDVLELSHQYGRFRGPSQLLAPLLWIKNGGRSKREPVALPGHGVPLLDELELITSCDMDRVAQAATAASRFLHATLPQSCIVQKRRRHFQTYLNGLINAKGARPLDPVLPDGSAPYVFPLWVDDPVRADAVYTRIRLARLPVFRWDRIWPGTPTEDNDAGPKWSRQVLQLLCHQDLDGVDVLLVIEATSLLLNTH